MATLHLQTGFEQTFEQTIAQFRAMTAESQLGILWLIYDRLGHAIASATPVAKFSQVVHSLIRQLHQLSRHERFQALRDIVVGSPTRFSEAYTGLDTNMKLAFWYCLAHDPGGTPRYPLPLLEADPILQALDSMDLNQQIYFLRRAVESFGL
ncbi:Orange carotenoid-binding protein [Halomicronema hongdechloris C2206]|uniref:Orange carotenoid-binding protein n=1 Tax=Halomicronema hongdechloris C2206 TaxID=1641165 RepID=A0A1Z3HKG9_9CYAN|nr:orange carotenoid protein N-terminal domain-containing protein [Halomicronema hongdechloris]ASC70587.1 Orange carotenoid-binding protein [Halomicronema hongdechloris C2206]